jgi:hypothetical protein
MSVNVPIDEHLLLILWLGSQKRHSVYEHKEKTGL